MALLKNKLWPLTKGLSHQHKWIFCSRTVEGKQEYPVHCPAWWLHVISWAGTWDWTSTAQVKASTAMIQWGLLMTENGDCCIRIGNTHVQKLEWLVSFKRQKLSKTKVKNKHVTIKRICCVVCLAVVLKVLKLLL